MDADFLRVGDHPALDLLNTAGRREASRDLLVSPADAAAWLLLTGSASEEALAPFLASPPEARRLLEELTQLRGAVGVLVEAYARGTVLPEEGIFALNRVLGARRAGLAVRAEGVTVTRVATESLDGALGLLAPVAAAAAELLETGDRARLRQCDAADCRLWFYDVSRNGRRRWCSMSRCGNRAKVAAHYLRHQT